MMVMFHKNYIIYIHNRIREKNIDKYNKYDRSIVDHSALFSVLHGLYV